MVNDRRSSSIRYSLFANLQRHPSWIAQVLTALGGAVAAGALAWIVLYKICKISSVGSLAGAAAALAVAAFTADRFALYALAAVSAVIVVRHKGNIRRLLGRAL